MNNAKLYKKSNSLQKRDAQEIMSEFSHLLDSESELILLDIGCGAGDVLVEVILPKLKGKILEVVGADISKEMVNYANEKYRSKFLKFLEVDIESDFLPSTKTRNIKRPTRASGQLKPESFSFITSFYCLHWIQNQSQAISNIHKLLKPNGTCLLAFLASNPIFDIYLDLSRMQKYAKYMGDVEHFISPYHFEKKPLEVFSEKLYDVGLKILHIEIRDQMFVFDDVELLKYSVKAVNPFSPRMPEHLQTSFLNDYVKKVDNLNLIKYNERTFRKSVLTPYKLMIAIANK